MLDWRADGARPNGLLDRSENPSWIVEMHHITLRSIAFAVLLFVTGSAHACRFARDAQPEHWFEWASALFAADVKTVKHDRQKSLDVITVDVVETFKGPEGAYATLQVPNRMWASCLLEKPAVGAHVLVALNPNGDALLVPLSARYTDLLRQHVSRMQSNPTPERDGRKSGTRPSP